MADNSTTVTVEPPAPAKPHVPAKEPVQLSEGFDVILNGVRISGEFLKKLTNPPGDVAFSFVLVDGFVCVNCHPLYKAIEAGVIEPPKEGLQEATQ